MDVRWSKSGCSQRRLSARQNCTDIVSLSLINSCFQIDKNFEKYSDAVIVQKEGPRKLFHFFSKFYLLAYFQSPSSNWEKLLLF